MLRCSAAPVAACLALLAAAPSLPAQEPPAAPVDLNAIPWVWGSRCEGDLPKVFGKTAERDYFLFRNGALSILREGPGDRLHLARQTGLPNPAGVFKYQAGEYWWSVGRELYQRDTQLNRWTRRYAFPGGFEAFEVLFDRRVLLVGTTPRPGQPKPRFIEVYDGSDEPALALPMPEGYRAPGTFYAHQYWTRFTTFPYEDLAVIYGDVSGRFWIFDAGKNSLSEVRLPWNSLGDDPEKTRAALEGKVPKCFQLIPTVGRAVILLYDARSVLSEAELRASADTAWRSNPKAPQWKALKVELTTREVTEIDVPETVELPMASPDGLRLEPLSTLLAREERARAKPKAKPAPKGRNRD